MKTFNIKSITIMLLASLLMLACDDDDSAFAGKDNSIVTFQIKKDDKTFEASISEDKLTVTVPEGFSLNGASATVTLSELAKILPDPSTITNWDESQTFTITSYNGTAKTYTYNVVHNTISKDGDIVLLTQADVDALAALSLGQINGSLTIGAATGTDSIRSLKGLETLKEVKYSLVISPTYAGKNLEGLDNLSTVGSLQIEQNKSLTEVSLPQLNVVMMNLSLKQTPLKSLVLPALTKVDNELALVSLDSLEVLSLPKLQQVTVGNVTLQSGWATSKLKAINLPVLETVGGKLDISNWSEITEASFAKLSTVQELNIASCNKLAKINFPVLNEVKSKLNISVTSENVTAIDFASLAAIGGDFYMPNLTKITNSDWIKSLKTVKGKLYISNSDKTSLDAIVPQLAEAKELTLSSVPNVKTVDLTKLKVGSLTFEGTSNPTKIIANSTCETKLVFSYLEIEKMPELTGIKHLGGLQVSGCNNITKVELNELEIVDNDLIFEYAMECKSYKMPKLQQVGARFILGSQFGTEFEFPLLKTVGSFQYSSQDQTSTPVKLAYPSLEKVETSFYIQSSGNGSLVGSLSFPKLSYIGTTFQLVAYSNPDNDTITNLDTFAALTYIGGNITIQSQTALKSYSGLKNALTKVFAGESTWTAKFNAYNPTLDDLKAGKWTITK